MQHHFNEEVVLKPFGPRPSAGLQDISTAHLSISSTNEVKFLGLTLDAGLRWKAHITNLKPKLTSAIYAIRTIQKNVGSSAALLAYHSYFHSLMGCQSYLQLSKNGFLYTNFQKLQNSYFCGSGHIRYMFSCA